MKAQTTIVRIALDGEAELEILRRLRDACAMDTPRLIENTLKNQAERKAPQMLQNQRRRNGLPQKSSDHGELWRTGSGSESSRGRMGGTTMETGEESLQIGINGGIRILKIERRSVDPPTGMNALIPRGIEDWNTTTTTSWTHQENGLPQNLHHHEIWTGHKKDGGTDLALNGVFAICHSVDQALAGVIMTKRMKRSMMMMMRITITVEENRGVQKTFASEGGGMTIPDTVVELVFLNPLLWCVMLVEERAMPSGGR